MKITYKNAVGLFTVLFVIGVAVLVIANFGFVRTLPIHGPLQTAGAVVIVLAFVIYLAFWRCPVCRGLLPRQATVPQSCKNCNARLADDN